MRFRVIDGLTVRFAQSEDRADHALLLGPWPESLLAFEPIWARLAERAHLVAVDLPGFGLSQRRDALLSPRAMAEFVIRVADAFGLRRPHVVGPDAGSAAALFAAAQYPGLLRSLTVSGGPAAVALRLGGSRPRHHQPGGTDRPGGHPRAAPCAARHLRRLGHGAAGRRPAL